MSDREHGDCECGDCERGDCVVNVIVYLEI
jgi:hypothetical protein